MEEEKMLGIEKQVRRSKVKSVGGKKGKIKVYQEYQAPLLTIPLTQAPIDFAHKPNIQNNVDWPFNIFYTIIWYFFFYIILLYDNIMP